MVLPMKPRTVGEWKEFDQVEGRKMWEKLSEKDPQLWDMFLNSILSVRAQIEHEYGKRVDPSTKIGPGETRKAINRLFRRFFSEDHPTP